MVIIVYLLCCGALILAGISEKKRIAKSIARIPLRINVNGIRGKSTATRFITAILEEAGYKVVGKTTGTSARMLVWGEDEEIEIKRRPVGPNIGEQVAVLEKTATMGAEALVCECMAVNPEYQDIYQNKIIQANIVVITNVVEDHLDEMGPTTEQIAWAFAKTIPYNGILVITEGPYADYFREEAEKRNSQVICMEPELVDDELLEKFPYIVFKNNCAIGYGVAKALGISPQVARNAMLNAHPDPGIAQVVKVNWKNEDCWLVNAFAANEPTSSLEIWHDIENAELSDKSPVLILCCRDDRVDRTHQFIVDFLPYVNAGTMMVIGTGTLELLSAYKKNKFHGIDECIDLSGRSEEEIISELEQIMDNRVVFCAGNIHGVAEEFLKKFADITI